MSERVYLANVGANASHRFASPLFEDGTFEFLTIPEQPDLTGPEALRYRDLRSFYDPTRDVSPYVPRRLWDRATHGDPEFETFTYGDNCETTPRAASLKRMLPGDLLLFLARLVGCNDSGRTGPYGFYLVGFLHLEEVVRDVRERPPHELLRRFAANAHVRRGLSDPGLWDGFWLFGGSDRSRRFRRAVPFTRELVDRVFTAADGSPWQWDGPRTDLQVIGSYTRSCRCVLDPALPGHAARSALLWDWIAQHEG